MSYHEIEAIQYWRVNCDDCGFSEKAHSAGEAERLAIEHVENESGYSSHIVVIIQCTLIGRQPEYWKQRHERRL